MNQTEMQPTIAGPDQPTGAAHQAIYRRFRAQTFAQIVGQEPIVQTLLNAVRMDKVAHAILFVGPRGTGKTSLARILAKALNCTDLRDGDPCDRCQSCVAIREGTTLDVLEIDAASNRGINEVKELRERLNYAPSQLRRKVYILDEAHQITKDAWNALLKSLEEPPPFVAFMFASTHPQDFPPAILSRLQRYDVRRLTVPEIEGKLARILEAEGRTAEPSATALIARLAAGGMRDAEAMLDQLIASAPDGLTEARVRELLGLAEAEAVDGFIEALVIGDARAGVTILDGLEDRGHDARGFLDQVVDGLRDAIGSALGSARTQPREDAPLPYDTASLAAAARRLAAIDPSRAGIGGLRLQLELALLASASAPRLTDSATPAPAPAPNPSSPAARAPAKALAASGAPAAQPPQRPPKETHLAPPEDSAPPEPPEAASLEPEPAAVTPVTPEPAAVTPVTPEPAAAPITLAPAAPSAATPDPKPEPEPAAPAAAPATAEPAPGPAPEAAALEPETSASEPEAKPEPRTGPDPTRAPTVASVAADAQAVESDIARLRTLWPEIVAHISQHPPTKPLISVCRPISVDGAVVVLGFPEDQAFLREVATRRGPILEAGIGHFLGREVAVRCVATNVELLPPVLAASEAEFVLTEARRIFDEAAGDIGEVS